MARLRAALDEAADCAHFADMAKVAHNPALIIQAWRDFVSEQRPNGRAMRGIGEPASADRNQAALVECHIHESLLNIAFHDEPNFWLLCPYDTAALPSPVIEQAIENHPFVCDGGGQRTSESHHVEHGGPHAPLAAAGRRGRVRGLRQRDAAVASTFHRGTHPRSRSRGGSRRPARRGCLRDRDERHRARRRRGRSTRVDRGRSSPVRDSRSGPRLGSADRPSTPASRADTRPRRVAREPALRSRADSVDRTRHDCAVCTVERA